MPGNVPAKKPKTKKPMSWQSYAKQALIAIVAVYLYNTFIAPKANLPTA